MRKNKNKRASAEQEIQDWIAKVLDVFSGMTFEEQEKFLARIAMIQDAPQMRTN